MDQSHQFILRMARDKGIMDQSQQVILRMARDKGYTGPIAAVYSKNGQRQRYNDWFHKYQLRANSTSATSWGKRHVVKQLAVKAQYSNNNCSLPSTNCREIDQGTIVRDGYDDLVLSSQTKCGIFLSPPPKLGCKLVAPFPPGSY